MRLTTNYVPLRQGISRATAQAGRDTLDDVRARQARRTGRLAAGTRLADLGTQGDVIRLAITNDVVYAGAVESGADVGSRRGPHMAGNHVIRDAGVQFPSHVAQRLRTTL